MFKIIAKLFYIVLIFIETLVLIRFILKLVNASTSNSLVSWVYQNSEYFISPFRGILTDKIPVLGYEIEVVSLVALVIYMIIAFIVVELMKTFSDN